MRRRIKPGTLRRPEQWCRHFRTEIIDRDGWRTPNSPDWNTKIDEYQFLRKWSMSTATQGPKICAAMLRATQSWKWREIAFREWMQKR